MTRAHRQVLALALAAPLLAATASGAGFPSLPGLIDTLTLGTVTSPGALFALGLHAGETNIDRGERQVLQSALADPISLLEIPPLPSSVIGTLTVHSLGPIHGPHITDIPDNTTISALAFDGPPYSSSKLRSFNETASVRNEDAEAQAEDLAALLD